MFALLAFLSYARGALRARRFEVLEDFLKERESEQSRDSSISIVIAARNERASLPATLAALGAIQDPIPGALEILVVDDRSTDGTGDAALAAQTRDARICVLRVDDLPDGWLGKPHALHVGVQRARGDWVLLLDADVHLDARVLPIIMGAVDRGRLDHLTIVPRYRCRTLLLRVLVETSMSLLLAGVRLDREGLTRQRRPFGLGSFNLFRRSVFARTEGFEALRLEVLDDMGVARLMVGEGARSKLLLSHEMVSVEWYPSAAAFMRGIEKVLLAGARFRPALLGLHGLFLLGFAVAPFVSLCPNAPLTIRLTSGAALLALVARALATRKRGVPHQRALVLLEPFGQLVLGFLALRTSVRAAARGHLEWRGTRHSLASLRAGRHPISPRVD